MNKKQDRGDLSWRLPLECDYSEIYPLRSGCGSRGFEWVIDVH